MLFFTCHFKVPLCLIYASDVLQHCSLFIVPLFSTVYGKGRLRTVNLCGSIQHILDNGALAGDNSRGLLLHGRQHRFIELIVLHPLGVALTDHEVPAGFFVCHSMILKGKREWSYWWGESGLGFHLPSSFYSNICVWGLKMLPSGSLLASSKPTGWVRPFQ